MMISEASDTLVTSDSRFRHSFEVALDVIEPDPDQARKQYAPEDIAALANTMAAQGQLQPILLRRHPSPPIAGNGSLLLASAAGVPRSSTDGRQFSRLSTTRTLRWHLWWKTCRGST